MPSIPRLRRGGPLVLDDAVAVRRGWVVDGAVVVGDPVPAPADDKPGLVVCRCGGSATRPWCDGSHRRRGGALPAEDVADRPDGSRDVGQDETTDEELDPPPPTVDWADGAAPVGVVVVDDGPMVVVGLPLVGGERTTPPARTGTAMCRCSRVPDGWCDGGCPGGGAVRRPTGR